MALVACASPIEDERALDAGEPFTCAEPSELSFSVDPGEADEAVVCFAFEVSSLDISALRGVVWRTPDAPSPTLLHHATLYAAATELPRGPVACDGMPSDAVGLHVWSPGGDDLELPSDVALALPERATQLVIEAHVVRAQPGAAAEASATLCAASEEAVHEAAYLGYAAAVPALRPGYLEESRVACELQHDAHLWSVWPHMHLAGARVGVTLRGRDGGVRRLVDVNPWRFHEQVSYRLAIDARAGDTLETHCRWLNASDAYVFPGPSTQDEMCNTGLIVWPIEAAACR